MVVVWILKRRGIYKYFHHTLSRMPIRSLLAVERNSRNSEGEGASEKNENPRSRRKIQIWQSRTPRIPPLPLVSSVGPLQPWTEQRN